MAAFVGEAAAEPGAATVAPAGAVGPLVLVALMLAGVAAVGVGSTVSPFHYADALAVVAVAVGPALVVLAGFAGFGGRLADTLAAGQVKQATSIVLGFGAVLVLAPGNVALWANQHFDISPAVEVSAPVVDMWTRRLRRTTHHIAGVSVDFASPLGRHSFYGAQPIEVTRPAYGDLVPGRTRFVLRTHRGALGFPWFEPHPRQVD